MVDVGDDVDSKATSVEMPACCCIVGSVSRSILKSIVSVCQTGSRQFRS